MGRFVEGANRNQSTLLPECLEDFIAEDNPVRIVDAFVDELDLASMGFEGTTPATTGRPSYHPAVLLKLYIYGYLNRVAFIHFLLFQRARNPNGSLTATQTGRWTNRDYLYSVQQC